MNLISMLKKFINNHTMYDLMVKALSVLVGFSFLFSALGWLDYSLLSLFISFLTISVFGLGAKLIYSKLFKSFPNKESSLITSLILFLIMPPVTNRQEFYGLAIACLVGLGAKYILAYHKKHLFNPAAFGALMAGVLINQQAYWWISSKIFFPLTLLLGLAIIYKVRKFRMFFAFFVGLIVSLFFTLLQSGVYSGVSQIFFAMANNLIYWPIFFFGGMMLTEPQTTPPFKKQQIIYGAIVGLFLGSPLNFGNLYMSPEFALILGNIYSFAVSYKARVIMKLSEKKMIAQDIYKFSFIPDRKLAFVPGQYLEWTLPMSKSDSRGIRRIFSIASAPNSDTVDIAMKIKADGSAFKKELLKLESGAILSATGLAGDFVLTKDTNKKLVFIAGGIGITPFMSMIDDLYNKKEKRDVVFFYSCATGNEFAFREDIEMKKMDIGMKSVCLVGKPEDASSADYVGFITADIIKKEVPDYKSRTYYLSGPSVMVDNYKKLLLTLKIKRSQIVTDYFPGY